MYRAAIIGLSGIAAGPAAPAPLPGMGTLVPHSHAAAYAAVPGVTLVAGCDILPAARERFLVDWSGRFPGVRAYGDWREMLQREKPDILSVVTPDHLHAGMALAACEQGVKMLYLEKPLATSHADCQAIIAAVERHGVAANVNHTRRWWPQFVAARQHLDEGTIGPLSAILAYYGGPRAMLFRNTCHFLDAICMVANDDPVWVAAELDADNQDYGLEYRGNGGRDPATDPGCSAWIGFRSGLRAYLSALKSNPEEFVLSAVGAKGAITLRQFDAELSLASGWRQSRQSLPLTPSTVSGMAAAVQQLIAAHETGSALSCPPREAYKAVRIILGILQSQAAGGARVSIA